MISLLLSVVVPTKNRYQYLIPFIEVCSHFDKSRFELIVQDNSDNNEIIINYLQSHDCEFVKYYYASQRLSMSENSELGIQHSTGKYICFMGDDDLLSFRLIDLVEYMDQKKIMIATFNRGSYYWPGVVHRIHHFPNLIIPHYSGRIKMKKTKEGYRKLLRSGGRSIETIPQLYHAVVKKEILDRVYQKCGTHFPGPSPDMAVAVALSKETEKFVYVDIPLVSSGVSPKSSAGLGAKHMHKGELKDIPFLPDNIEEMWDLRIPKVWTGSTIYAESISEALRAYDCEKEMQKFSFSALYANFDAFNSNYKGLSSDLLKKNGKMTLYYAERIKIILIRSFFFLKNVLLLKLHIGGKLFDGIDNTVEAEKKIDDDLAKHRFCFDKE